MTWTLKIGGTTKTLAAWGVESCVLSQTNREADRLELTVGSDDATAAIMANGDNVTLYKSGAAVFSGECITPASGFSGSGEANIYTVMGPLFFLDRQLYRQKVLDDGDPDADPPVDPAPVTPTEWTNEVTLFQDESKSRSTTVEQIEDILDQTSRITGSTLSSLADLDPLGQSARSISLREALNRCLNYHPKAVVTVTPAGALTATESLSTYDIPLVDVVDTLEIRPRPDLTVSGVVIRYSQAFREGTDPVDVEDTAGATSGEGVLMLDYDLGGVSVEPTGLAQHFYDEFSALQYEASYTQIKEECSPGDHLGKALNITGGVSAWSSMAAPVQRATYDIIAGSTTVECGPLPTLALKDLIELLRLRKYDTRQDGGRGGGGSSADNLKFTLDVYDTDEGEIVSVDLRKFQ